MITAFVFPRSILQGQLFVVSSKVDKKMDGYFRTSTVCTKSIRPPPPPSNPGSLVFDNNLPRFVTTRYGGHVSIITILYSPS